MLDNTAKSARAFSLVELLVVILIIAIVIAIIVPALAGARTAARNVTTTAMLTDVNNGAAQFSQDHGGNMPGYFNAKEMGGIRNMPGNRGGFTTMENALLDLVAENAIVGEAGPSGGGGGGQNVVGSVGPMGTAGGKTQPRNVSVDLDLIGTGNSYLDLDADTLRAADGQNASPDHQRFPDIVDAFGNPVLAWAEDPMAKRVPEFEDDFARETSREGSARFYWHSNSGWLTSVATGRGGKSQELDPSSSEFGSLLNLADDANESLTAVLGNPSFPTPTDYDPDNVLPSASRGAFVVHSAGADGIYFGVKDKGAAQVGIIPTSDKPLQYAMNFFPDGKDGSRNNRWKDDKGLPITRDLIQGFDDMVTSTGN